MVAEEEEEEERAGAIQSKLVLYNTTLFKSRRFLQGISFFR